MQENESLNPAGVSAPEQTASKRRIFWVLGLFGVLTVAVIVVLLLPVGYVIHRPGPTVDVLRSQGETEVLEFGESEDGSLPTPRTIGENDGQLRMVTVSEAGGPGDTIRVIDVLQAKFEAGADISRYSDLYDDEVTAEQVEQAGSAQMTSSHSAASIAAFDYLGLPMDSTLTIAGAAPGSDAEGKVEEGDILVSIETPDGVVHAVDRPSVPFTLMKQVDPDSTVVVTVERDGKEVQIPITTAGPVDDEEFEGSKMGIYLSADTDLPIDVTIHLERIGGPSAGLIFALGIVDRLSQSDITGGENIAGTGALTFAGDVVPIGGVKQKMYGAQRDGAKWFLAPESNCADVVGNIPKGLTVIPVRTLSEAVGVVEAIGDGQTEGFPSCEAAE